ncbi:PglA, partial [Pasteurella multocida subsp. multocida str. Anand1_goat]
YLSERLHQYDDQKLNEYDDKAVIGLHGILFPSRMTKYFRRIDWYIASINLWKKTKRSMY